MSSCSMEGRAVARLGLPPPYSTRTSLTPLQTLCPQPEKFAKAVVRHGLPVDQNKTQVTLRIDSDVLEWFKSQGQSYQTQINSLLRAYMEAHH